MQITDVKIYLEFLVLYFSSGKHLIDSFIIWNLIFILHNGHGMLSLLSQYATKHHAVLMS